jgi:membrane-bound lytic murein transglycosylase B
MSNTRGSRGRKALALVPIALLSAAWTASIAGVSTSPVAVADQTPETNLPDGTSVPSQAIDAPASVTGGDALGTSVGEGEAQQIIASASTNGIPSAALSAYQRAETVINAADPSCHLPWQLVAAIGRVESNHGRANGNVLDSDGVATPGIYGVPLNGANQTAEIVDTDAGQFDNDTAYDRAVGPMQFIPSTWSVVGVDADGDGVRNPQDIDDAALGTAVYLCSGTDDLATETGRRTAVFRYNHSQSYVDLVLAITDAYVQGDYTSVPDGTILAGGDMTEPAPVRTPATQPTKKPRTDTGTRPTSKPTTKPTTKPTKVPTFATPPTQEPTTQAPPTRQPNTPDPTPSSKPSSKPTGGVSIPSTDVTIIPPLPTTSITPVDQLLNFTQATLQCTADGFTLLTKPFNDCVDRYMTGG